MSLGVDDLYDQNFGQYLQSFPTTTDLAVTVVKAPASITLTPSPASVNLGGTVTFTPTVKDQWGNVMTTATVVGSLQSGPGSVAGATYTAPAFTSPLPGTAVVLATASVAGQPTPATVTDTVTINDVAPTGATLTGTTPITQATDTLTASATYPGGVSNLTFTYSLVSGPGGGTATFSPNGTLGDNSPTVTFNEAGTYNLQVVIASPTGLTATATKTIVVNQAATGITISPTNPTINIAGQQQFTASVTDQFGIALTTQPTITWTAPGPGTINASGLFQASGTSTNSEQITATDSANTAITGYTFITVADVAPTINSVMWTDPKNGLNGHVSGTSEAFTVNASYLGGTSKLTYSWSATGPFTVSSWTPNGTNAASTSTAVFAAAGTYTVTVTATTPTNIQTTFSFTVHVDQTGTAINITPSPASCAIGSTVQLTPTELDQFGAVISPQPTITWSKVSGVGSVNSATGLFTGGSTIGTAVVQATDGTISNTVNVNVVNNPPTVATAAAASPNPVTSGTTTNLTVLGAYAGGEAALTYTWSATGPGTVTYSANGTNASKNTTATFAQSGVYTFTVVINDGAGGSTSSSVSVTVKQKLTTIVVIPSTFTLKIGDSYNYNAQGNDQFGQAMAPQPTFTWSISSGLGSIDPVTGIYTAPLTTTTATVVATSGTVSGTGTAVVIDATPTFAADPSASPNPVYNTTTNLSVLGAYIAGESNLTYTWSATGPGTVTYSDNGDNTAKNTVATFSAVGSYVFTATLTTPGGKTASETVNVTVLANPTVVTVTPNPVSLPINGTQAFSAAVTDQFGAAITSPSLVWSVSSPSEGTISAGGLLTAGTTPGGYSVTATCTDNGQAASGSANVTITDISPTIGTITANPNPVTGTTTNLTVTGNYVSGGTLTYTWGTTAGPAAVSFAGGTSGTSGSPVTATATFVVAGTYTIKCTVTDAYGTTASTTTTVTVNQTATAIDLTPTTATVPLAGTTAFTADVVDQFGNNMTSQPTITWSVTSGGGSINSSGVYTAPTTTGSATIQAAASGFTAAGSVTIVDSSLSVATAAAATPNPVTATTTAVSVLGAWAGGEPNLTYTWAGTGPGTVTFSVNGTNASKNSVATFTAAGSYTLTVTITDTYGATTTSTVTVTVNQTLTTITVSPNPGSAAILGSVQFTAVANDQFGTPLAVQPAFNWALGTGTPGSIDNTGKYTAGSTTGSGSVKAGSGTVIGTATIVVTNVAPVLTAAAAANPSPVTGTTTTLTAKASWVGGANNLTYTWSETAGPAGATFDSNNGTNAGQSCVATFTQAGAYTFLCTIADPNGGTLTTSVNVVVSQTPTAVIVSPHTATTSIGGSSQVSASVNDQFGNPISPIPTVTWTVTAGGGSVNSSGLYTAPGTVGTATVTASLTGATSDSCVITINDVAPTVATPAAATPNPVTATTTALSVLGAYPGGESTLTYTWSASGPAAVTYSANGTNAAKASTATFTKAGSYVFTVTIKNASGLSTTSQVTVTVNQTATGVVVTPSTLSIATTDTYTFTASATDQFGNAMATQPTFTWSLTTTDGSTINSGTGIFTAGATAGTATVKATATGGAFGTSAVTIIAGAPHQLNGSVANPGPLSVNLTTEGTTDWIHYGSGVPGINRDASGGSKIGAYTLIGTSTPTILVTDPRSMSWSNGTPTASASNNKGGLSLAGTGSGFTFTAPADLTLRTLVVYVGGKGESGKLTAHISDGSSADYVNTQTFTTSQGDAAYTITYAAESTGQTLTITWQQSSGSGTISLTAADLH